MVNRVSVVFRTRPISNMVSNKEIEEIKNQYLEVQKEYLEIQKRKQILFKAVQEYLSFLKNEKKRKIGEIKVNCEEKIKKIRQEKIIEFEAYQKQQNAEFQENERKQKHAFLQNLDNSLAVQIEEIRSTAEQKIIEEVKIIEKQYEALKGAALASLGHGFILPSVAA